MYTILRVLLLTSSLALSACMVDSESVSPSEIKSVEQQAGSFGLKPVKVNTSFLPAGFQGCGGSLPACKNEPTDWTVALTLKNNSTVSGHETRTFTSADQVYRETEKAVRSFGSSPEASARLANTMKQRFARAIDFSKNDALVFYRTSGGPPFAKPLLKKTTKGIAMCMKSANAQISGAALSTQLHIFAAPKGTVADGQICK